MDKKAFFDVKVFNPFAKSNQKFAIASFAKTQSGLLLSIDV